MTAGVFALAVGLGSAWRILAGVTFSTALETSATEANTSASYIDSSSSYSYEFHPDYPDCNNSNPLYDTIGDGSCDISLNVASCGWDGGDCCACTCNDSITSYGCTYNYYCEDPSAPLYLEDLGCYNETLQAPQVGRCPQNQVDEWVVDNTANAAALAKATLCSSGDFAVKWKGHVIVNATIYVLNGTSLHITGISDAVADGGGEVQIFFLYNGSLDLNNMTITNGAGNEGGAIAVAADSELFADYVTFSFNTAQRMGGAVFVSSSIVELVSTTFDGNSASNGGAIFVHDSALVGSGNMNFIGNNVSEKGGALYAMENSYVGWNMRRVFTEFTVDFPSSLPTYLYSSWYSFYYSSLLFSWAVIDEGGETDFFDNSAGGTGGAIYADDSEISWSGTTSLGRNSARYGGAIYMKDGTTITSEGVTTFASNYAVFDGGGIGAAGWGEFISNGSTIFTNNTCGGNGGAIDLTNIDFVADGNLSFSHNLAVSFGGALYASQVNIGPELTGVTFLGNTAEAGGAVFFSAVGTSAYQSGSSEDVGMVYSYASTFNGCRFDGNSASSTGGAIHSTAGSDYVWNTTFVENSAEIGGGMRVSGAVYLSDSSFEDNKSGDGGGPAVSNGGVISKMAGMYFSGNGYHCSPDAFFDLDENAMDGDRYEIVCDGCDIECEGCIIEDNHTSPVCSELLAHTDSDGGIATLDTLVLDPGYWRATYTSRIILQCFNEKACRGGVTGNPEYCLTGYEGPSTTLLPARGVQRYEQRW